MRREDDRDAGLRMQLCDEVHHACSGFGVEVAGRLVGDEHSRLVGECSRDRDTLLLAT